ncbi:MAG: hypothetical protein QM731_20665 [Chitinophagaceae bacterium]
MEILIYTDGSCHTKWRVGAWVAILFISDEKVILNGVVTGTTHQRMELMAVIKALEFIKVNYTDNRVLLHSDSQYVLTIPERSEKIAATDFISSKGKELPNTDLVKTLLQLIPGFDITYIKIKAHQKANEAAVYNCEADKLSRKLVRDAVKNNPA